MNCPKLCGQYKKPLVGRFSNELTSLFEWCQFCFELDTFVVVEVDISLYDAWAEIEGILVKNFEETKGKANQKAIWRYRALASDFICSSTSISLYLRKLNR